VDVTPIRFADFRIDPTERRLEKGGVPVELGARAFDLLLVLVQSAGRLVTKGELLDRVWPDVIVEEANLHVQMTALRKAVGRNAVATVPGRGYQFVLPLQAGQATPAVPATSGSAPLKAVSALPPLLGRDDDLASIARALADPTQGGFVTVTGAGGSGKTLLARHLAARFGTLDGAAPVWVDLLELTAPEAVVPAVAIAAEVQGPPRRAAELAQALADAQLLLVLDNAEHVLAAVTELAAALRREAPGVRLLVTSQAPLRCAGEAVHVLAGLSVPAGPCSAEEAVCHAAVALFVAQAKQADRRCRFVDACVDDVVAICASLGGSALGVQLAAALLGQMPLAALRERLARRETGPDTAAVDPAANVLRSALTWSHDLLPPLARQVFRRLAVAQGPLPLALALAVSVVGDDDAARDEATEALADLVDRSLVQFETGAGGAPCYRLLEAPRALALEFLRESGERAGALVRLARALAPLGDAMRVDILGDALSPDRKVAMRAALPVAADTAAAFEALLSIDGADAAATAIRVADALLDQHALQRPAAERMRWATALRERAALSVLPAALRARGSEVAAGLIRHSDLALRGDLLLSSARLWSEVGQTFDQFRALARATDCAAMRGRHDEAAALLARVRDLEDPAWPPSRRRWRWFAEGVAAVSAGDLPRAMHAWRQQLQMTRGDDGNRVQALHSLANAEQIGGDAAAALPRLVEAVDIARRIRMRATLHAFLLPNLMAAHVALGNLVAAREAAAEGWLHARAQDAEAWWADHLAMLAVREGRQHTAARLLGLADAAYARLNDTRQALEAQAAAAVEAAARSALGDQAFAALRADGGEPAAAGSVFAAALAQDDSGPQPLSMSPGSVARP
jgi:predicted ATPase/DNA-binding winged helix-turn-helix (wHTH) protein